MAKKKKLTAKSLTIRKTPDPNRCRKSPKIGKKWDMGICEFLAKLFVMNERELGRGDKMTDSEIMRQVNVEFDDEIIKKRFSCITEIRKTRSEYNRGRLTNGIAPPTKAEISFPYNENGDAVNPRYSPARVLTEKEKQDVRNKYYTEYRKPYEDQRTI